MREKIRPAVAELHNALDVVNTNAPINEREGNLGQARLERTNAKDFKSAIGELSTAPKINEIIRTLQADLKAAQTKLRGTK